MTGKDGQSRKWSSNQGTLDPCDKNKRDLGLQSLVVNAIDTRKRCAQGPRKTRKSSLINNWSSLFIV